jgi:hypothetical protein
VPRHDLIHHRKQRTMRNQPAWRRRGQEGDPLASKAPFLNRNPHPPPRSGNAGYSESHPLAVARHRPSVGGANHLHMRDTTLTFAYVRRGVRVLLTSANGTVDRKNTEYKTIDTVNYYVRGRRQPPSSHSLAATSVLVPRKFF